jgi:hypothetical protein
MAAAMTPRPSWPWGPIEGYRPDDSTPQKHIPPDQVLPDQEPAEEVIGAMAQILCDTRSSMLVDGGILSAIVIGMALDTAFSARVLRPGAAGAVAVFLLCGLLFCWLAAVALLAMAGRPVHNALSEVRWRTGAPLDPRARWLTLPPTGTDPEEWAWVRAHLLLGAARLTRHRIQLADTWTYATAAFFMVWTVAVFLGL